jgi:hypothetical protein
MNTSIPRIRKVDKHKPLYKLNNFPKDFLYKLAKEIVYLKATRNASRLEGNDWEEIFANIIGAKWKPSNIGLDDIVCDKIAWGAKTVKAKKPSEAKAIRLISGRNSITYSFGNTDIAKEKVQSIGNKVLSIWNERVLEVKNIYPDLRTIVLIKSDDLLELAFFEIETCVFDVKDFKWEWNKRNNLEGFHIDSNEHVFTWQPHGAQFTIIEKVPENRIAVSIKNPVSIDKESVIKATGFDKTWVQIIK